jgi:cytidylate kinase
MRKLVIAVDGPAAAGKSTASKALADREGIADAPGHTLGAAVSGADIRLLGDPDHPRVLVEGRDVSREIRTERISQLSSKLSALPEVRAALLDLQRRLGADGGVVMDGRDIGTVIFPGADAKFFVFASPEVRARRRHAELLAKGIGSDPDLVRAELEARDRRDAQREHAPLKAADDAVAIDTTDLDPEAVIERMLEVVESRQ